MGDITQHVYDADHYERDMFHLLRCMGVTRIYIEFSGGAARSALRAYFFNIGEFEEGRAIQLDRERRKEWKSNYDEHIRR